MRTIHWIGTGLSSTFGIDALITHPKGSLHIWMREKAKAPSRWKDSPDVTLHTYDLDLLGKLLSAGDIVISMLPYTMHLPLAKMAVERGAHFVCSSYLSSGMLALDEAGRMAGSLVAGEMGLDPGIDHMLTHALVQKYKETFALETDHSLSLLSLCGGIPLRKNSFCYQFAWSPLGILRALRQPSTWLENGEIRTVAAPYHAVKSVVLEGEEFEYYPNRDSLAFIDYYGLPQNRLKSFLRGSIRPKGWKEAWMDIFHRLPRLNEEELLSMSQDLYEAHAYKKGERDRVVLFISLEVSDASGQPVRSFSACLDVAGNESHHAMTTLVCLPLLVVIDGIIENRYPPGILRPSASQQELDRWLQALQNRQVFVTFQEDV